MFLAKNLTQFPPQSLPLLAGKLGGSCFFVCFRKVARHQVPVLVSSGGSAFNVCKENHWPCSNTKGLKIKF